MNHLDLFAGIGGFALAARMAGWTFEQRYFSEVDDYAIKVYEKNFPEARFLGDIRTIDGTRLRDQKEWIVTGGFPCQDISTAGQGRGLAGSRSGLWHEMSRLIDELRPRWVIAENVPALANRGLDRVLYSLAEIGYDAEWQIISARAVGAAHLRERLWIVAYPQEDAVADTNVYGLDGRMVSASAASRDLGDDEQSHSASDPSLAGADWQARLSERKICSESIIRRIDDGLPDGLDLNRGKCLGNAIVPQVAELIFRMIGQSYINT